MEMLKQYGRDHDDRPQNKTLVRGLTVLSTIEALGRAKLTAIARETGLPKPTVSRLLQTLSEQGYIRELGMRRGYARMRVPKPAGYSANGSGLQALSRPILDAVIAKIKFPTCLAIVDVPHVDFMIDSSDIAPFHLSDDVLVNCASLTGSAAGIAYLARLPERQRRGILSGLAADMDDAERACALTLEQGFAVTDHDNVAPGLRAIAVSVQDVEGMIGSITTHFVDDYVTYEQLESQFYPELLRASRMLGELSLHSHASSRRS